MQRHMPRIRDFLHADYNALLICLVFLLIFRPFNASVLYLGIWKILMTGMILLTLYSRKLSKFVRVFQLVVAVPAIGFCWLDILFPWPVILIIHTVFNIIFTFSATFIILRDVILRSRFTAETLKGVICAYFLVAVGFAYLFWLIERFVPGSFSVSPFASDLNYLTQYLSEMLYFSFVTLLTIGYGDIVATKDVSQTAVIIEGIIGQFYMAILVARLVSVGAKNRNSDSR